MYLALQLELVGYEGHFQSLCSFIQEKSVLSQEIAYGG